MHIDSFSILKSVSLLVLLEKEWDPVYWVYFQYAASTFPERDT